MTLSLPLLAIAPASIQPLLRELPLVLGYTPLYVLGFAAARAPAIWRTLTTTIRTPVTILVLAGIGIVARPWWLPHYGAAGLWWLNLSTVACAAWCPPAAAALILRSASLIRRAPRMVQSAADASFTIYILHYPIIMAVHQVIAPLLHDPVAHVAVLAAVGAGLPYAIHHGAVRHSPILRLALNGVPIVREGTPPSPVPGTERSTTIASEAGSPLPAGHAPSRS